MKKFFVGMKKLFNGMIPGHPEMKKCLTETISAKNFFVPTHPRMEAKDSGFVKFKPYLLKISR